MLWDERNSRPFGGVQRNPQEIWSLVCFHVSLWASISKTFCNYSIDIVSHSWNPLFVKEVPIFVGFFFLNEVERL